MNDQPETKAVDGSISSNLLRLLHLDRIHEASQDHKNNPRAITELEKIKKLIADGETFGVGDSNCEQGCDWNGTSRRCDCGNRRIYWRWFDIDGIWCPETY